MTNRIWRGAGQIYSDERGFTLLEIILVLLLIITVSAMIMPNIFRASSSQAGDEAEQLVSLLRLASEEAQISGRPVRWVASGGGYHFEGLDISSEWQLLNEKPFTPIKLYHAVIKQVRKSGGETVQDSSETIGSVVLLPDSSVMVDIILTLSSSVKNSEEKEIVLQLRPGPNGIRIIQ